MTLLHGCICTSQALRVGEVAKGDGDVNTMISVDCFIELQSIFCLLHISLSCVPVIPERSVATTCGPPSTRVTYYMRMLWTPWKLRLQSQSADSARYF
jgi:hypothetical protein